MSSKISALSSNSTLDFTETVPIVQGGVTKKMALSQLSGRLFAKAAGLWYPLAHSAVPVSHTGDTSIFTHATVTIPAGAMGPNGRVRITVQWGHTNSANNKTLAVYFGGTGGTSYQASVVTTSLTSRAQFEIANRNSQSSQIGNGNQNQATGWGIMTTQLTSSIDTSAAVDIVFRGTLANSSETITLDSYLVEILYQA